MKVNGTVVVTPIDNPGQYDPDWRNLLAMSFAESSERVDPVYMRYRSDPWVRRQVGYLRAVQRGLKLTREQIALRLAGIWFQGTSVSDVRFRLEPLLLTPVEYRIIALDMMGSEDKDDLLAIEAYEKIYFNIRDDKGRLSRSCQLRQYFALPSGEFNQDTPPEQMWKMIGSLLGYDTLVSVWLWKDAHGIRDNSQEYLLDEMWRVAQSRLFMSMFADRVGHESMAKLLASISAQQKLLHDSKSDATSEIDAIRAMQSMLSLVSPRVIDATAREVDSARQIEIASEARMEADRAVAAAELPPSAVNGGAEGVSLEVGGD